MLANKTYLIVLMTLLCLYQMTMMVKSFPVLSIEDQEGMNLFERNEFDGQKDLETMFYKRAGGANRAAAAAQMQKAGTWAKSQVNVISKTQFGQSVRNGAKTVASNPHVQKVVETVKPYVKQGMTHAKTGASYVSGKASSFMSKFTPAPGFAAK